jgi:murein DD-endopeptidase MepM/ murein hydrolase activator NlpD
VLYPGNYDFEWAAPSGYSIPGAGEIRWAFGSITDFMVEASFSGLGPDRPLLDFPVDYQGRADGSSTGFRAAFANRITSRFDHEHPNYTDNDHFLPYTGEELDNPGGVWSCEHGVTCYDGHNAYDIDDRCPTQSPCSDASAVYAAADGEITEAGWLDNAGGCQIVIDHGDNWSTRYAHLRDANNDHTCDGILQWSGEVTRLDQIGIIGESGSGAIGTHLHFAVEHNGVSVDPSGWEPDPAIRPDPWAEHPNGADSYTMWLYSLRSTQALDPTLGGTLASPTHETFAVVPPNFYSEQLMFNLSTLPAAGTSAGLVNTGHSFSLTAMDNAGSFIHELDANVILEVRFDSVEVGGIDEDSLSFYGYDPAIANWVPIPTIVDWPAQQATAQTDHLSSFALMGKPAHTVYMPIVFHNY